MAHLNPADIKKVLDESDRTYNQGDWRKAADVLGPILMLDTDDLASLRVVARALILRGLCFIEMNESAKAEEDFERALGLARQGRDQLLEGEALIRLAHRLETSGDYKKALEQIEMAEVIAQATKDIRLEGLVHSLKGAVFTMSHRLDVAEREFREGVLALEKAGDMRELSKAYNNFGNNFVFKGEHRTAAEIFDKCRRAAERAKYGPLMILSRMNMGQSLAEIGKFKEALAAMEGILQMVQRAKDDKGIMDAYEAYGIIYAKMGEWQKAEDHFFVARTLAQKRKVPYEEGRVLYHIGRMHKWKGDATKALRFLRDAKAVAARSGITQGVALIEKEIKDVEGFSVDPAKKH
jgi:tetratricopeptide (TPR) repeat protein